MNLTATAGPHTLSTTHDDVFAQLALDVCLDVRLAGRYAADPHAVLAERGVELAAGRPAPDLVGSAPLAFESTALTKQLPIYCWCFATPEPS